jgi:hypothetical protein
LNGSLLEGVRRNRFSGVKVCAHRDLPEEPQAPAATTLELATFGVGAPLINLLPKATVWLIKLTLVALASSS